MFFSLFNSKLVSNNLFFFSRVVFNDSPEPWGLFFQDNATPQMEGLEELHNNIMFYLAITLFSVSWIMFSIILNYRKAKFFNKYINHKLLVELIWTITPALILVLIAFPSFKLLYLMDEVIDPSLVIYAEGHQWYWSYQYPSLTNNDEEFVYNSILFSESSAAGPSSVEGPGSNSSGNQGGGSSCSCGHNIPGTCSNCTYHIPVDGSEGTLPIEALCCHCGQYGAECICSSCNCTYHIYCLDFVNPETPLPSDFEETPSEWGEFTKEVPMEEAEPEGKGKEVIRNEPEGKGKEIIRDEQEKKGKQPEKDESSSK